MNKRYREFLDAAPAPWQARFTLIGYARVHGVRAAMRKFGASKATVNRLLDQANKGTLTGRPRVGRTLTPEDEIAIVKARLAMPGAGPKRLKRELGLPYGTRQISRVLRARGLARKFRKNDPLFRLDLARSRLEVARMELTVAKYEIEFLKTKPPPRGVERALRRIERAEAQVAKWLPRARKAVAVKRGKPT